MKSIFENAKFGDKFRTRDGRMAYFRLYEHDCVLQYMCLIDGKQCWYRPNGKCYLWKEDDYDNPIDIVSKWEEPINKEELVESATKDCGRIVGMTGEITMSHVLQAYKKGYMKRVEEE